jgi:hypothetical protein
MVMFRIIENVCFNVWVAWVESQQVLYDQDILFKAENKKETWFGGSKQGETGELFRTCRA